MDFTAGPLKIVAVKTEAKNNNLPQRFLETFVKPLTAIKENLEVYNLNINGSGRDYFSPAINAIGMYFLGEFAPAEEYSSYIPLIEKALK